MKFGISNAFLNTREITESAKADDDLGYDNSIGIPYHVVNLETLNTPYPLHPSHHPAAVCHHHLHARDGLSLLGDQSHWHRGILAVRTSGARHRR
ncbi:hypothetical protein MLPF_1393 [Mycobacterium lepromatosis]|uniref:Uncharacterized protein n=1 Tax=Mycobacterium lepromatosis TaxID=480418 RepID=A0A0F4ER10_9MYCO|nr:hypothetical protein MLPM_0927 [Mycobacterium lepromatosis]UKN42191.1 hypothetical protein MLPF_1393 [Mycobacterium lepromatosis]